ncbi:hypothetical protein EVAR_62924_1 [Eumeta japonica]|uniref:Uncharacterized protein n=1 Tax=Eumeta variegata TaxID=151549 RepID=A0A4C1ZN09_EUMVA|nr:hypothetical protein EVAR_62924_1 [Eumeta japonica]
MALVLNLCSDHEMKPPLKYRIEKINFQNSLVRRIVLGYTGSLDAQRLGPWAHKVVTLKHRGRVLREHVKLSVPELFTPPPRTVVNSLQPAPVPSDRLKSEPFNMEHDRMRIYLRRITEG